MLHLVDGLVHRILKLSLEAGRREPLLDGTERLTHLPPGAPNVLHYLI